MSTTLLVVIIFAMVISPIFWLMPSRRQRYQMHLRKMALHAGIKVRLEKFELNGEKLPATAYRWMRDADEKKQLIVFVWLMCRVWRKSDWNPEAMSLFLAGSGWNLRFQLFPMISWRL